MTFFKIEEKPIPCPEPNFADHFVHEQFAFIDKLATEIAARPETSSWHALIPTLNTVLRKADQPVEDKSEALSTPDAMFYTIELLKNELNLLTHVSKILKESPLSLSFFSEKQKILREDIIFGQTKLEDVKNLYQTFFTSHEDTDPNSRLATAESIAEAIDPPKLS